MKPAAFVSDGPSLEETLDELRTLNAKVFAMPAAVPMLVQAGILCQTLGDPMGVRRLREFGHKEIHLFGFDLCVPEGDGARVAFENEVYYTTQERATHAQMLVAACLDIAAKGVTITAHGKGMFQAMLRSVLRDMQERVLTAVYDMQVSPPTYEVFSFLAEAEKYREAKGYTCIDVVFAPGPMHGFRDDGLPPSTSERASMLHRICVSGARLLPSVRNIHVMTKRAQLAGEFFPPEWTNERPRFHYGPRFQKNGHACLEATRAARDEIALRYKQPYVTITLREADYWPKRNSNRAAWERVSRWLQWEGMTPIIIPDTHGRGLVGWEEFSPAAWDVDLRLALYEGAVLNLGVVNGPMVLCMFAKCRPPYLLFQKPDEESPGTQEAFMLAQGIKPGDGYTPNGWTVWENDTPDNVMRSVQDWFSIKAKKEVSMTGGYAWATNRS